MKLIIALALFFGLAASFTELEYQDAFMNWMQVHHKVYSSSELQSRFTIFKENMDYVYEWNAQNSTTVLGLNIMADLSNEEYQRIYLGYRPNLKQGENNDIFVHDGKPLADSVNWATKGAVTGIKDQGQCGSCWSFSSTGSIEGVTFLKTGKLVSLSEQNLMDCSVSYGNHGCNGGLMDNAFKYVIANKGIDTEASYPYTMKTEACHYTAANSGATISGFKDIPSSNEAALTAAINMNPVSVAIDASQKSFQLYSEGVYYEAKCSSTKLDHGVLAVGYGTDTDDYYVVKNSWGASWGMKGYINMARNKKNNCGIATSASYPIA